MRQSKFRNIACVIGLAAGLSMVGFASGVQAQEYVYDENGAMQYAEDGLPLLEGNMTITGTRRTSVVERLRQQPIANFLIEADMFGQSVVAEKAPETNRTWLFAAAGG